MVDWYEELADLIGAQGKDWFGGTLQGALQSIFHYDYFLKVLCRRGEGLQVARSDFSRQSMSLALRYYETETYIGDPIYRLFEARRAPAGVFDMNELAHMSKDLPRPDISTLKHIILDPNEEIGFRTLGWPKHLQETVILIPVNADTLLSISLYNVGLERTARSSSQVLQRVYPVLAAIVARHYEMRAFDAPKAKIVESATPDFVAQPFLETEVMDFFAIALRAPITQKEAAVFTRLLQGISAQAVADDLCLSVHTVKTHRRNVYRRIGHMHLLKLISQFHEYLSSEPSQGYRK